jgi:NADH dehydrogenase
MENNSKKNSTVLVVGATGVLGMEVCRQLAAAGKKVKGLVRTSSKKEKVNGLHELGVKTVTGEMKDPQSLYQAFKNVDAIISTATSTISYQEGDSIETVEALSKTFSGLMIGLNEVETIDMKETLRNFPIQLTSVREYARQMIAAGTAVYSDLQIPKFLRIYFPPPGRPREAANIGGRDVRTYDQNQLRGPG